MIENFRQGAEKYGKRFKILTALICCPNMLVTSHGPQQTSHTSLAREVVYSLGISLGLGRLRSRPHNYTISEVTGIPECHRCRGLRSAVWSRLGSRPAHSRHHSHCNLSQGNRNVLPQPPNHFLAAIQRVS